MDDELGGDDDHEDGIACAHPMHGGLLLIEHHNTFFGEPVRPYRALLRAGTGTLSCPALVVAPARTIIRGQGD